MKQEKLLLKSVLATGIAITLTLGIYFLSVNDGAQCPEYFTAFLTIALSIWLSLMAMGLWEHAKVLIPTLTKHIVRLENGNRYYESHEIASLQGMCLDLFPEDKQLIEKTIRECNGKILDAKTIIPIANAFMVANLVLFTATICGLLATISVVIATVTSIITIVVTLVAVGKVINPKIRFGYMVYLIYLLEATIVFVANAFSFYVL